jgi:hypothetical protein
VAEQPKGQDYELGRKILLECKQAYQNVATYSGRIEAHASSGYQDFKFAGEPLTYKVAYKSPATLRLDGFDSNHDPLTVALDGITIKVKAVGDDYPYASTEEALYAMTGVTLYASLIVPGCLLDMKWKNEDSGFPKDRSFLDAWATKARFDGAAKIDDRDCDRVVCERDTQTWTLYVDQANKLLRRADLVIDEDQMKRLRTIGEGGGASGRVLSLSRSQLIYIDDVTWKQPEQEKK